MANYIGKIAAVVTANVSDVAPKLSASAREWNKYGKSVQASIDAARRNARSSFDQIFTAQQRLERAFAASRNTTLRINTREGEDAIRRLIGAADELARPLVSAQKQFSSLSSSIQNEFGRALSEAQNAARSAAAAINETGRLGEQSFERYKRRVDEAVVSIRRLSEANAAVGGLATGRELRFQQAGFAAELQRTSALQSQASALPADARASGAVAQLVELQRREAEEAARLLAVLENVRNTRRGDAAAAQANLDAQTQRLAQANSQLERQVSLYGELAQRRRQAAEAESSAAGRFSATELNRRSGALARRNAVAFEDSTASLLASQPAGGVSFGREQRTLEAELARVQSLSQRFLALPPQVRQELETFRSQLENNANAARSGAAGLQVLIDTYERVAAAVTAAESAVAEFRPIQGNATGQFGPTRNDSPESLRRREAENQLGLNVTEQQRGLDGLRAAVASVADQAERLPAAVRGRFIPALRDAQQEYVRLFSSGTATVDQIDRAAARVRNLETQIGRASRAAQQFGGTFRDFADASDFRAAAGGLEFLRQTLLRATGDTRAAEDAVDRYSAALQRAATVPGGFRQFAGDLSRIRQQAVAAVAATEGVGLSARRINEGIRRTGDVARGSFGNTGLAIQQAAFIVDDFFSVTGGIEQRIRAIGNNISQLGFIVGGTYGLIVGVAVSVGAQAASALIKWANAGRSTENQTRALNEILQRQKTVVEELASAFNSLGQQIVSRGFSPAAAAANELADRLKEIVRLQREAAESSLTATSQGVADRRADQDVIRQRLESETNVGRRAALQRQLVEAQQAERETSARARASDSPALRLPRGILNQDFAGSIRPVAGNRPTGEEVAALLRRVSDEARQRATSRQGINRSIDDLSGSTRPEFFAAAQQLQQFAQELNLGTTADAIESQAAALQQAIELFKGSAERTLAGFNTDASNEASEFIRVLSDVRARILDQVNAATSQTITQTFQEADRASRAFADAQRAAQEAVERGVAGSEAIAADLDAAAEAIKRSIATINEVLAGVDSQGRPVERTPEQIRGIVNREQENIRQLQPRLLRAAEQTLQSRLGRVVGGERATAALQSLQGAESFANEYAGLTAQLQRAVELERIAREQVARSNDAQSAASLAAARAASDLAASVAEAALAIDADFARLRQAIDATLQASQQAADEAQRRVSEAGGFGGRPIADLERERDRAQANLLADRSRLGQLGGQLQVERALALQSPQVQGINRQIEDIRRQREVAGEAARLTGRPEDIREAVRLSAEQTRLENERSAAVERLTAATRKAIEAESQAITQRERQAAFQRVLDEQAAPTGDAVRGLDAIRSQRSRSEVQVRQNLADIEAAASSLLQAGFDPLVVQERRVGSRRRAIEDITGLGLSDQRKFENALEEDLGKVNAQADRFLQEGDRQAAIDSLNNAQRNLSRQNAPLFAQFSDEVANAVLQGPSRAALQVSDASTSEGQRELNRLLRGDDSARDVNLVELQKQSEYLQSIDSGISTLKERLGIAQ